MSKGILKMLADGEGKGADHAMKRISSIGFNITAAYVVVSVLWILTSDYLVYYLFSDAAIIKNIEVIKGWFFVAITAALLYNMISKHTNLLLESEGKLQAEHEETMIAYEELIAAEEELKQQFEELLDREGKINRRNECLNILHEVALFFMQGNKVENLLEIVVNKMRMMSGAQYGYIYLLDENNMLMKVSIANGFPIDEIKTNIKKGDGIIGRVWESGDSLVVYNYHKWQGRLREPIYSSIQTGVGVPIKAGEKIIGVFSMNYTVDHVVDAEELKILESFAEMASMALSNTYLQGALQESQHNNQALIDALPDSIFQLDQSGTLLDYKGGKESVWTMDIKGRIGEKVDGFLPREIAQIFMKNIEEALCSGGIQLFEYRYIEEGRVKYQEVRVIASSTHEVIAIGRDITNRKELEHRLHFYALHDRVTGLYNRVRFEERLQQLEDSSHLPICIVVCDIDGLKLVNDTFGHQVGDDLLVSAANILGGCFAGVDVVARVGGDEFAIIILDKEEEEIEKMCHRVRIMVKKFRENTPHLPMNISMGISMRTSAAQSIKDVFKAADDAMYREKLHSSQSVRSSIVHTLSKALEVRDFVTDGHADRLQRLVVELAMAVGLPESKLPDLRLLGRFHDIGKVGIPDNILFKPGRLNVDEYEIMKRHSEIGYRIAQSSGDLAPIGDWILKHQEWWNGEGYPLGIKGNEIPLACRILAIADAFDAMTNDRPYRKAMSYHDAIAELENCSGTQFDPELVAVFKGIVYEKKNGHGRAIKGFLFL